jgi:pyruvate-formate lyase-activating enzyme
MVLDTQLSYQKFEHPEITAKGDTRAWVDLNHLDTLWFNTGSLCNITCKGCYMESSPTNDALVYITHAEVCAYLDEIHDHEMQVKEIAFTGGEPFMNPDMIAILQECLERGFQTLVLTNAMKPLHHKKKDLLVLNEKFGDQLIVRVSIDHYSQTEHESLRGENSWKPMLEGLNWLSQNGFHLNVAGRTLWHEAEETARNGYKKLFAENDIKLDETDPIALVLFPEMDETVDVPEITTDCWSLLNVSPDAMMCANSRMIVKRKGADHPVVMPCTLLPYDARFEMGHHLQEAQSSVALNHPHCAKFCVLGGGSCSK